MQLRCPEPVGEVAWEVVDERGAPVQGAVISGGPDRGWSRFRIRADAAGTARLPIFGDAFRYARIEAPGHRPTTKEESRAAARGGRFVLQRL